MSDEFGDNNTLFNNEESKADDTVQEDAGFSFEGDSSEVSDGDVGNQDTGDFVGLALGAAKDILSTGKGQDAIVGKSVSVPLSTWKKVRIAEINNVGTGVTVHHLVFDAVIASVKANDLPEARKKRGKGVDSRNLVVRAPAWWWASLEILTIALGKDFTVADIIAHAVKNHTPKM